MLVPYCQNKSQIQTGQVVESARNTDKTQMVVRERGIQPWSNTDNWIQTSDAARYSDASYLYDRYDSELEKIRARNCLIITIISVTLVLLKKAFL